MEEFKKRIKSALESMLGDSYEITETEVTKVNDSKHPTLVRSQQKEYAKYSEEMSGALTIQTDKTVVVLSYWKNKRYK